MAYVGVTNQTISQGGAADKLYALYGAMVSASWSCLSSGGGAAGGYSSSGSLLNSAANFNSNGAWVRMREPSGAGGREYILMRGSAATSALVKYSRSDGFTGGSPAAAVCPTTNGGDGQIVYGSGTDATATGPASGVAGFAGSSGYVQAIASTTPINGVYGFWNFTYAAATGTPATVLFSEGVAVGSTDSSDGDPSWRIWKGTDGGGNASNFYSTAANAVQWWQKYNLSGETYITGGTFGYPSSVSNVYGAISPLVPIVGLDPYSSKTGFYPLLIGKANTFPKGYTTGVCVGTTQQNLLDVFNISGAEPRIVLNATYTTIVVPWVPNIIPLV